MVTTESSVDGNEDVVLIETAVVLVNKHRVHHVSGDEAYLGLSDIEYVEYLKRKRVKTKC